MTQCPNTEGVREMSADLNNKINHITLISSFMTILPSTAQHGLTSKTKLTLHSFYLIPWYLIPEICSPILLSHLLVMINKMNYSLFFWFFQAVTKLPFYWSYDFQLWKWSDCRNKRIYTIEKVPVTILISSHSLFTRDKDYNQFVTPFQNLSLH